MYYVRVKNGQIVEGPRNDVPELTEGLRNKGWLPCNYGDYRPGLDEIGGLVIYTDRVEYPITEIAADILITQIKKQKETEIRAKGSSLMLQITTPYTPEERDTWPSQVAEAHAYSADSAAVTPIIDGIYTPLVETKAALVNQILANEAAFKVAVGQVLGVQRIKIRAINAATTVEQVNAITWGA